MSSHLLRAARRLRGLTGASGVLAYLCPLRAAAQVPAPLRLAALDSVAAQARLAYQVPGLAVAIVQDGRLVLARGYGVRSLATQEPVDANTLFDVGAVSCSFRAAALGLLVAQGELRWNDPLADYLPELVPAPLGMQPCPVVLGSPASSTLLADFQATAQAAPGPAGGLALGRPAGRPAATVRTLVADARYLGPATGSPCAASDPRSQLAGELLVQATGRPWTALVAARLLGPLGLARSGPCLHLPDPANVAAAHALVRGRVRVVPRDISLPDDPAGTLYSSAADLSRWVRQWVGSPGAPWPLPSAAQPVWGFGAIGSGGRASVVAAYGLAWSSRTVRGYQVLTHQSGSRGMWVRLVVVPELHLGLILLANQEEAAGALLAIDAFVQRCYLPATAPPALTAPPATARRWP